MSTKYSDRVERIKRKYGANCFKNWGETGGSPYLLALRRGDKLAIRHRQTRAR